MGPEPQEQQPYEVVELIRAKRDGGKLADAQVDWVIEAYTRGLVADEQMSALAMAIFFRGLDRAELTRWTRAMINSGERLDFGSISRPTADKHSTGGVGDKITLPLTPVVAACAAGSFWAGRASAGGRQGQWKRDRARPPRRGR